MSSHWMSLKKNIPEYDGGSTRPQCVCGELTLDEMPPYRLHNDDYDGLNMTEECFFQFCSFECMTYSHVQI